MGFVHRRDAEDTEKIVSGIESKFQTEWVFTPRLLCDLRVSAVSLHPTAGIRSCPRSRRLSGPFAHRLLAASVRWRSSPTSAGAVVRRAGRSSRRSPRRAAKRGATGVRTCPSQKALPASHRTVRDNARRGHTDPYRAKLRAVSSLAPACPPNCNQRAGSPSGTSISARPVAPLPPFPPL